MQSSFGPILSFEYFFHIFHHNFRRVFSSEVKKKKIEKHRESKKAPRAAYTTAASVAAAIAASIRATQPRGAEVRGLLPPLPGGRSGDQLQPWHRTILGEAREGSGRQPVAF